jgi:PAS domain S-box-containing protein
MREVAAVRVPAASLDSQGGLLDRALIDAALAVNGAPTIEDAARLLAEHARTLVSADTASVVGIAGEPVPDEANGSRLSVPVGEAITLMVGWHVPCAAARLEAGFATLSDLADLTRLTFRTSRGDGVLAYFLEDLFDSLPTALGVSDPETGAVTRVNRAVTELTGWSAAEMLGVTPPYPWVASAEPPRPGGEIPMLVRHKSGRLTPVEVERLTVEDAAGKAVARVSVITDVGERRHFEQQLIQSGKLASIGELAAGVAHEINNPLFAILGLTEFLLEDAEPGSKSRERLEIIRSTGIEIRDIVRSLLDFARERSDELVTVSLAEVVRQTVELFRRTSAAKHIEIVERYADDPTLVQASPNQLKQIFVNLLSNARQAMPGGGEVTVAVEREGGHVVARVADTGPGIPEGTLPRIFEPFYTTKRDVGGTGLGLSVSLGIAQSHGGALTVRSQPGEGACFALSLPAKEAAE